MPSSLSWIDYDNEAQQRAQRILTLFKDKDTRDELGIGQIRDAISDSLFPGTSVLHTRLRYMLFIPWIYHGLEDKRVSSIRIRDKSRSDQLYLASRLKTNGPSELGIIGGDIGDKLKTLPSAIYWAGLNRWGIRIYPGTEGQYQRALDDIYRRRRRGKESLSAALEDGDDVGGLWEHGAHTFHPGLPQRPEDFPDDTTFRLSKEEARFLQERVRQHCGDSLLAHLLSDPVDVDIDAPWEHPDLASFRPAHQDLLHHGRMFSLVNHGAAILYNLMLAEILQKEESIAAFREAGMEWLDRMSANNSFVEAWARDMPGFWQSVQSNDHEIADQAKSFVERWMFMVLKHKKQVFDSPEVRQLIRSREIQKKKGKSRFTSARARDQWGGSSGMRPMIYRWHIARAYVKDMAEALK